MLNFFDLVGKSLFLPHRTYGEKALIDAQSYLGLKVQTLTNLVFHFNSPKHGLKPGQIAQSNWKIYYDAKNKAWQCRQGKPPNLFVIRMRDGDETPPVKRAETDADTIVRLRPSKLSLPMSRRGCVQSTQIVSYLEPLQTPPVFRPPEMPPLHHFAVIYKGRAAILAAGESGIVPVRVFEPLFESVPKYLFSGVFRRADYAALLRETKNVQLGKTDRQSSLPFMADVAFSRPSKNIVCLHSNGQAVYLNVANNLSFISVKGAETFGISDVGDGDFKFAPPEVQK